MEKKKVSTREKLLAKMATRLSSTSSLDDRKNLIEKRFLKHARNTIPARGKKSQAGLIELFTAMLTAVQGTVAQVESSEQVPGAIADYLRQNNLEFKVCLDEEVERLGLPWTVNPEIEIESWQPKRSISVGITACFGAVAETGSLVVCSSRNHSITMNFLSETNIVILNATDLVGVYEDIWDRLRSASGLVMPRDLTLISGPSCTGDIEMILEFGAHGPKRLHVILVGVDGDAGPGQEPAGGIR